MSNFTITPRAWMDDAHCRSAEDAAFYPPPGQSGHNMAARAKAICGGCPARIACLDYALEIGEEFGIWGGLDPIERKALRRASA